LFLDLRHFNAADQISFDGFEGVQQLHVLAQTIGWQRWRANTCIYSDVAIIELSTSFSLIWPFSAYAENRGFSEKGLMAGHARRTVREDGPPVMFFNRRVVRRSFFLAWQASLR
jgi:hypothetical protein